MDKTEEYVLMCREAEEIQVLCKYEAYDYFANPKNFRDIVRCGDRIDSGYWNQMPDHILESEKWIWLPQQNKLQKILGCVEPYWGLPDLLAEVNGFIEVDAHDSYLQAHPKEYYRQFKTWEQFWLAIVMLLKFKKRWNKSKWCLERSLSKGEIGMV